MLGIKLASTGVAFLGVLAMTSAASADHKRSRVDLGFDRDGFHLNIGRGDRVRHGHHGHRDRGYYRKIWVPPVYRTVHEYLPCGTPNYRQVVVRRGYYKKVWVEDNSRSYRHGRRHGFRDHSRFDGGRRFDRFNDSHRSDRNFRHDRRRSGRSGFRGGRRVDLKEVLDKVEDIVDELD